MWSQPLIPGRHVPVLDGLLCFWFRGFSRHLGIPHVSDGIPAGRGPTLDASSEETLMEGLMTEAGGGGNQRQIWAPKV